MAIMTLTVSGPGITASRDFNISDVDLGRLVSWAMAAYPKFDEADPERDITTPNDGLFGWVNGLLAGTMANVVSYEKREALKAVAEPAPLAIEAL